MEITFLPAMSNPVPLRAVSPVYTPTPVIPPHHSTMGPHVRPLVDSPTLHVPTQSVRVRQWPTDLQQPSTRSQPQLANQQQQHGNMQHSRDLMSPPLGEDLLDSSGEPFEQVGAKRISKVTKEQRWLARKVTSKRRWEVLEHYRQQTNWSEA